MRVFTTPPAQVNSSRAHFITADTIEKVIGACPDAQWRLIVALSRYGGLRCPSEHLCLTWGDVDWEHNLITIRSPKTEHHVGGESSTCCWPESSQPQCVVGQVDLADATQKGLITVEGDAAVVPKFFGSFDTPTDAPVLTVR